MVEVCDCALSKQRTIKILELYKANPSSLEENQEIHIYHYHRACLNHLVIRVDVIINALDPMQNSGQNRIFYEVDETHLTRDPDDPDSPPLCREIKCPVHVFNSGSPLIEAPL